MSNVAAEQLKGLGIQGGFSKENKLFLQNPVMARIVSFILHKFVLGPTLDKEGYKLLISLARKTWMGEEVSVATEISQLLKYAKLTIEVAGEQNIPTEGTTVFVANHTNAGPLRGIGQYFKMVQVGYDARTGVEDPYIREPYIVIQRGLSKHGIGKLSGIYFDVVGGRALGLEVVAIPRFKKDENGEKILNYQGLKDSAIKRVAVLEGAALWMPQGRDRHPEDFNFPSKNGFLVKIASLEPHTQVVPICSVPDSGKNITLVFGKAVDIRHVIANGGIQEFGLKYIAPLRQNVL